MERHATQEVRTGLFNTSWKTFPSEGYLRTRTFGLRTKVEQTEFYRDYEVSCTRAGHAFFNTSNLTQSYPKLPSGGRLIVRLINLDYKNASKPRNPINGIWLRNSCSECSDAYFAEVKPGAWKASILVPSYENFPLHLWMDFGTMSGEQTILDGLGDLYAHQTSCDVEFHLKGGATLRAHTAVLTAGSLYFAAMFGPGFQEGKTGQVDVEDFESHVFDQLLAYLYTGRAPKIAEQDMARSLYEAADKYGVESLMKTCINVICNAIETENVVDTLIWSHLHSLHDLMEAAMSHIAEKGIDVLHQPQWKTLMLEYPDICLIATQRMMDLLVAPLYSVDVKKVNLKTLPMNYDV